MSNIETKFRRARVQMLLKYPFFGELAMRLNLVEKSHIVETAATDGRNLYYNAQFIEKLSADELVFLVAHEVFHVVYDHMSAKRREDRDPFKMNIAADYVINGSLVDDNIGKMIEGGMYHEPYTGEITEWVYDQLDKDGTMPQQSQDCHISFDPTTGECTVTTASGKQIKTTEIEGITAEQAKKLEAEIRGAVLQASQTAKMKNGSRTGSSLMDRMLDQLVEPQIDWRSYLMDQITSQIKDDYSFARPSRKCQGQSFILPSLRDGTHVEVTCALDVSGSISNEEIIGFVSEIRGMVEMYQGFKLTIFCFHTEVDQNSYGVFTHENMSDLENWQPSGTGGTDFDCIFEFLKENTDEPTKQLVIFTDGYPCGRWGDEDYCPTLFLITDKSIEAPFGTSIHYDNTI